MEKLLMDVVNAGIAIFRSGEDKLKNSVTDLEKAFEELKQKGELDQSEQSKKLRDLLNKTIDDAKGALDKSGVNYEEIVNKLKENYNNISTQVEAMVPADLKDKVKNALEELKKLLNQNKA
jgi:(p)ppGpp synthase/HD superfamily hydrolase